MPRLTTTRPAVLLPAGLLLGAAGAGLAWLGYEERVGFLMDVGLGLAGGGLACLIIGTARGLWLLFTRSRDLGLRAYRRHREILQPVLVALAIVFVFLAAVTGHNYLAWSAIERDCELALETDDRVEAQWALNQGLAAMDDPLLLIPSDLLDLWGPNRCRSAVERHQLVLPASLPGAFQPPAGYGASDPPSRDPAEASEGGSPSRPQNRKYSLRDQGTTDPEVIAWLAGVEPYNGLVTLDLRGNRLTADSLAALAGSQIGVVHTLLLSGNPLGDAGARVLAESPAFATLTILYLSETGLGAAGLDRMLGPDSRLEPGFLTNLDLSGNPLGDEGARILAASSRAGQLTHLELERTGLTDRGALALARSPHLGALEYLSLDGNDLTDAGVAAAREAASWPTSAAVFFGEEYE